VSILSTPHQVRNRSLKFGRDTRAWLDKMAVAFHDSTVSQPYRLVERRSWYKHRKNIQAAQKGHNVGDPVPYETASKKVANRLAAELGARLIILA
jgi:hypothetical protein